MDILCRFCLKNGKKSVFIFLIHFSNLVKIISLDHSVMGTLGSTLSLHEYNCTSITSLGHSAMEILGSTLSSHEYSYTSITCAYFPLE